ncbi:MAG: hypothetical protein J5I53_00285 [Bradyrhizobiaceae bacterium]|nr:hypothetical protein [Bradyrhizobiaceae bacterium]
MINHDNEIEVDVFNVLESLETIVQSVIGDRAKPPGGVDGVHVMKRVVQPDEDCKPLTDLHYPPYTIRMCSYEPGLEAAAAYEFAHEICHVWLGVAPSNALAEVICECASWYFLLEMQNVTGIPYYNDAGEPYPGVHPDRDVRRRMIVPMERDPNHLPAGRRAMVLLAKYHLVPWIVANPVFWTLLPQIGRAMGGGDPANREEWNDVVDWDVILDGMSTDPERGILQSFREQFEQFAVLQ